MPLRSAQLDSGHRVRRGGFTLVEVVIALAISAMLLLSARLLVEQLADGARRMNREAALADREANAERLLRQLVGRMEVGTDDAMQFSGQERVARFSSWCDVPAGWQERCRVALVVDSAGGRPALSASLVIGGRSESIVLRQGFEEGALRYLNDPSSGGQWFHSWGTGITTPLAIGIVLDRDTLIVRIGERG